MEEMAFRQSQEGGGELSWLTEDIPWATTLKFKKHMLFVGQDLLFTVVRV